jgi:hypothetical protein
VCAQPGPRDQLSMLEQHERYEGRRLSRRTLLKAAAVTATAPWFLRQQTADAATLSGPRWLAFGADPAREMAVSTSLTGAVGSARLDFGPTPDLGASVPLDVRGVARASTRYGRAVLADLSPGTTYHYAFRADGVAGPTGTFRTASGQNEPFTFTAFGDEATTPAARQVVTAVADVQPAFHLLAGDLCYADSSGHGLPDDAFRLPVWDHWLRVIQPIASQVPFMNAMGNHEMEPGYGPQGYDGYLSRFVVPTNGATQCPATYHFRHGSVAFVQVDSNEVSYEIPANLGYSGGAQTRWLDTVLAGYRADPTIDFLVVTMHHCAFSTAVSHGSDGGIRDHWVDLFDRHGVDLVLSGHNHAYERTHPIRAGRTAVLAPTGADVDAAAGTTYLTVGGGGSDLGTQFSAGSTKVHLQDGTASGQAADWSSETLRSYCFVACSVTPRGAFAPAKLAISARDQSGAEFDAVTLTRASTPLHTSHAGSSRGLIIGAGAAGVGVAAGAAGWYVHRNRVYDF